MVVEAPWPLPSLHLPSDQKHFASCSREIRKLNGSLASFHRKQEIICKCYKVFPSYVVAWLQIAQKLK